MTSPPRLVYIITLYVFGEVRKGTGHHFPLFDVRLGVTLSKSYPTVGMIRQSRAENRMRAYFPNLKLRIKIYGMIKQ